MSSFEPSEIGKVMKQEVEREEIEEIGRMDARISPVTVEETVLVCQMTQYDKYTLLGTAYG